MKRNGIPALSVTVYGDWETVISARDYRDCLLNQKPDDPDDAHFKAYRVLCNSTEEMVAAYHEFRDRLKLRCYFGVNFTSEDGVVRMRAETGDGWSSNTAAHCDVFVQPSLTEMETAVYEAIKILKASVK